LASGDALRRMVSAKSRHRPRLKNWARDGYATCRFEEFLALEEICDCGETIERVNCGDLNPERFAMDYEATSTPVIVRGVPESEGWAASEWSYDRFLLDPALCSLRMKCGEDDDGGTIRVSLKDFATYVSRNCMNDDSPLYVFDSGFSDREGCKPILDGFCVPCFCGRDDLFELVYRNSGRRPGDRRLLSPDRRLERRIGRRTAGCF